MKKKKIAKYMQETETPTNPKALYDKETWGDLLIANEKTFLRLLLNQDLFISICMIKMDMF